MTLPAALDLKLSDSAAKRFWSKVDQTGECWLWTAHRNRFGYGAFGVGQSVLRAHRVSFADHYGPIPAGLVVCHTCDNRACVRPSHLFLGTYRDNTQDAIAKGRFVKVVPAKRKEFCKNDHRLSAEARIIDGRGHSRGCRLCRITRSRDRRRSAKPLQA